MTAPIIMQAPVIIKHNLHNIIATPPQEGPHGPLVTLKIRYKDIALDDATGYITVHPIIAEAVHECFAKLYELNFPIYSMFPLPFESDGSFNRQAWQKARQEHVIECWTEVRDKTGVRLTRAFIYQNSVGYVNKRRTHGKTDSHHAYGLALDINPFQNPLMKRENGLLIPVQPPLATYNPNVAGTLTEKEIRIFTDAGFISGTAWQGYSDIMHFSWKDCQSIFPDLQPELPGAIFL